MRNLFAYFLLGGGLGLLIGNYASNKPWWVDIAGFLMFVFGLDLIIADKIKDALAKFREEGD